MAHTPFGLPPRTIEEGDNVIHTDDRGDRLHGVVVHTAGAFRLPTGEADWFVTVLVDDGPLMVVNERSLAECIHCAHACGKWHPGVAA